MREKALNASGFPSGLLPSTYAPDVADALHGSRLSASLATLERSMGLPTGHALDARTV